MRTLCAGGQAGVFGVGEGEGEKEREREGGAGSTWLGRCPHAHIKGLKRGEGGEARQAFHQGLRREGRLQLQGPQPALDCPDGQKVATRLHRQQEAGQRVPERPRQALGDNMWQAAVPWIDIGRFFPIRMTVRCVTISEV